jgi:rhamnogalacturonyl hydrolase YesR
LEYISEERNMFVAENSLNLIENYGKHTVYTEGGTWYPEGCKILGLKDYLSSSFEKRLMERTNQYFKDRFESFDVTIHAHKKMSVIYFMYITGYNSLYLCNNDTIANNTYDFGLNL